MDQSDGSPRSMTYHIFQSRTTNDGTFESFKEDADAPCSGGPVLRTSKSVFDNSWLYARNVVLLAGVLQKSLLQVLIQT